MNGTFLPVHTMLLLKVIWTLASNVLFLRRTININRHYSPRHVLAVISYHTNLLLSKCYLRHVKICNSELYLALLHLVKDKFIADKCILWKMTQFITQVLSKFCCAQKKKNEMKKQGRFIKKTITKCITNLNVTALYERVIAIGRCDNIAAYK